MEKERSRAAWLLPSEGVVVFVLAFVLVFAGSALELPLWLLIPVVWLGIHLLVGAFRKPKASADE